MSLTPSFNAAALVVEHVPSANAAVGLVYIHTPAQRPAASSASASAFGLPLLGHYLCFNASGHPIVRVRTLLVRILVVDITILLQSKYIV